MASKQNKSGKKALKVHPSAPSPNGSDGGSGRDSRGRFARGNSGGPGNPLGAQVARLRSALIAAVSEQDIRSIIGRLVKAARSGDAQAAKLLLSYAIGQPIAADLLERLESVEAAMAAEQERGTAGGAVGI